MPRMVFYKVYVTINNNHVKSKIVKTKPFGFMKIFEINTFFTMCIKLDTLLLGDVKTTQPYTQRWCNSRGLPKKH
jgi:hypothetical protein